MGTRTWPERPGFRSLLCAPGSSTRYRFTKGIRYKPTSPHSHRAANIDRWFPGTCRERRLVRVGSHRGCSRLVYHQPWQHEQDLNFFLFASAQLPAREEPAHPCAFSSNRRNHRRALANAAGLKLAIPVISLPVTRLLMSYVPSYE